MSATDTLSDAFADALVNWALQAGSFPTLPTTFYLGLVTTAPTDNTGAGFVECSGGSYARVAVTRNATNFSAASARAGVSAGAIAWPTATADWAAGTTKVQGVIIMGAASGGTYYGYGALRVAGVATPVNVLTGDIPTISAGNFSLAA